MDRTFHLSRSHAEADQYDREQHWAMTPSERLKMARALQLRVYGDDAPDVRAAGVEFQGVWREARSSK